MKIAILGAGLAGLSIAKQLEGYKITIFEKENKIGGLCRSYRKGGFVFDIGGSHILFSRDEEIVEYIKKLFGDTLLLKKRKTKILYGDKLVKYPFENGIGQLEKKERIECIKGYIEALIKREKGEKLPENFRDWVFWKFGQGFSKKYMIPYNEKIWKFPLEKMSSSWVEGRIPDPDIEDLLKAALEMESEGYTHQLNFYYPKEGGIEQIITNTVKNIKCDIKKNQNIEKIRKTGSKWIITSNNKEYIFDILISTIPIDKFVQLLDNVPESILNAAENLVYNSLINLFIGVKGEFEDKYQDLSWMYIPEWKKGYFHRVSFPSNFSKENAPKGCHGINIEITTTIDSAIWKKTNEEIINDVISDLEEIGMIKREQVLVTHLTRWEYAYVIFDLNYDINIKKIQTFLAKEGIYSCGRFAQFKYLNMDHVIKEVLKLSKDIKEKFEEM